MNLALSRDTCACTRSPGLRAASTDYRAAKEAVGWPASAGEVVLDPDEQVRTVIALVFSLFDPIGTVGGVLAYLAGNRIQAGIRLREGPDQGEPEWRRPSRAMIQNMLRYPAYAGIYAYGRSSGDPRRRQPERPYGGRKRVERLRWLVFLPGIYPSYISAEQYERNMRRMDANRSRAQGMGAVRDGPALLAGLVRCGRCGRKMTVRYQREDLRVLSPTGTETSRRFRSRGYPRPRARRAVPRRAPRRRSLHRGGCPRCRRAWARRRSSGRRVWGGRW